MDFNGRYEMNTPPHLIWNTLLDPDYIIHLTPEVSTITELDKDHYRLSTHIKVGPFKRRFEGIILLERIEEEKQFNLNLTQQSALGSVKGNCLVTLFQRDPSTEVNYEGVLHMDGLIGKIGSPIVKQMIHPVIHNFLDNFDQKMTES